MNCEYCDKKMAFAPAIGHACGCEKSKAESKQVARDVFNSSAYTRTEGAYSELEEKLRAKEEDVKRYKYLFEWLWAYGDFNEAEQEIIKQKLKEGE